MASDHPAIPVLDLSGTPVLTRNDPLIAFNWNVGAPGAGVPADNFSVRWTKSEYFAAGRVLPRLLVERNVSSVINK